MSLTPGKDHTVQTLPGTIYEEVTSGNFKYMMYAPISAEAILENPVWTIWREDQTTMARTCPTDGTVPTPDGNVATDPTLLTYWSTAP